jgi:thiol-disulfide isomerase/thioredoxin
MTMKTLAGDDVNKVALAGKYVVLYFWGTHQGGWLKGVPKLVELKDKYGDKFETVIVNCRANESTLWQKELQQKGLKWGDLFDKYAGNSYPTKVILSPDGEVVGVYVNQTSGYNLSFAFDLDGMLR